MSDLHWHTVRDQYTEAFNGETIGANIEAAIIEIFELAPQTVLRALEIAATDKRSGEISSGWAITHARLTKAQTPVRDVTVSTGPNRAKAITRAEQWIRLAGVLFDREGEVEDELFGDRGQLKDWPELKPRMLTLWREQQPRRQELEDDQAERDQQSHTNRTCPKCGYLRAFAIRPCPECARRPPATVEPELAGSFYD